MKVYFFGEAEDLRHGISLLGDELGFEAVFEDDGENELCVELNRIPDQRLEVRLCDKNARISFSSTAGFFRALGHLFFALSEGKRELELREPCMFSLNGPMFDVSQGNAVINVPTLKYIIRKMALMGLNMLMLYCEDSYDVPTQPYFGYMRSRYSAEDIRELDAYAKLFGIEMIPCIQTLAHLQCVLKWKPYKEFSDDMDTLLVGDERTYDFISQMISSATEPFSSRRIHIGMDEAMMLGQGKYLEKNGPVSKTKLLKEHLEKVMDIVRSKGLEPMMWSDMFMRVLNEKGSDYYSDTVVTDEVKNSVPSDVSLVYWDYYHDNTEFYEKMIDKHRVFSEPIFAGGIWTWMGFGPNYAKTLKTTHPALMACKNKSVKEVIATVWGDNGTECSIFATFPMLCLFAEHGYTESEIDEEKLKRYFSFCFGCDYDSFMLLQKIDEVPGVPKGNWRDHNCSKPLLWQDVLSGLCDYNFKDLPLNDHYLELFKKLEKVKGFEDFFDIYRKLSELLALKAEAGIRLRRAYLDGDRALMTDYSRNVLPKISKLTKELRLCHMEHWFKIYKPLGWDVFDMRYGALLARLDSAKRQIEMYLEGKLETLPELDEPRIAYNGDEGMVHYTNYYGKLVSASRIDPKPVYPHYLG